MIAISGDAACGSTSPLDFALLVSTFTGQLGSGAVTAGILDVAADILKAEVGTLLSTVLSCNILFCEGDLCSEPGGHHPSQVITIHRQQSPGIALLSVLLLVFTNYLHCIIVQVSLLSELVVVKQSLVKVLLTAGRHEHLYLFLLEW